MLSAKRIAVGAVLVSVILVVALGGRFGLLHSAETGSFDIQVATYFGFPVYPEGIGEFATLIVSVNSPSGPMTQLLGGNFEVKGFYPSEYDSASFYNPERVGFENLGGGFYRIDVEPTKWQSRQYVFMVTASSSRGPGVGLGELPLQLQAIN
ncbi:hypothetical protein ACFLS5_04865 [Candidatus Bipolaricaulota bacterium]